MSIVHQNTSFLLVLLWDGNESVIEIKDSFKRCFDEKQHVEILLLTDKKRPKEGFDMPSRTHIISSKSDYSIFGKLKSHKLLPTEYTHFDVSILLDQFNSRQEKMIQLMNIKHIVGFGYDRSFIKINLVQSHEKPTEKIIFAKQILTKISD
jgi:hypothetical protein